MTCRAWGVASSRFNVCLCKAHNRPQFSRKLHLSICLSLEKAKSEATFTCLSVWKWFSRRFEFQQLSQKLFHTGGALAEGSKELTKKVAGRALLPMYAAAPIWCRRFWRPPIYTLQKDNALSKQGVPVDKDGLPWDIYTTTRFISYGCLAWTVTGLSFRIFWWYEKWVWHS